MNDFWGQAAGPVMAAAVSLILGRLLPERCQGRAGRPQRTARWRRGSALRNNLRRSLYPTRMKLA